MRRAPSANRTQSTDAELVAIISSSKAETDTTNPRAHQNG
jgi:hypothetical protein